MLESSVFLLFRDLSGGVEEDEECLTRASPYNRYILLHSRDRRTLSNIIIR